MFPHLYIVNYHASVFDVCRPGGIPLRYVLYKIACWTLGVIKPGLVALAFREPPRRPANRDVQDKIEILIKGRGVRAIYPRVHERGDAGAIENGRREIAALEERLVETQVKEGVQPRVYIDADEFGRPFQSVGVEAGTEGFSFFCPPTVCFRDAVEVGCRTPV